MSCIGFRNGFRKISNFAYLHGEENLFKDSSYVQTADENKICLKFRLLSVSDIMTYNPSIERLDEELFKYKLAVKYCEKFSIKHQYLLYNYRVINTLRTQLKSGMKVDLK